MKIASKSTQKLYFAPSRTLRPKLAVVASKNNWVLFLRSETAQSKESPEPKTCIGDRRGLCGGGVKPTASGHRARLCIKTLSKIQVKIYAKAYSTALGRRKRKSHQNFLKNDELDYWKHKNHNKKTVDKPTRVRVSTVFCLYVYWYYCVQLAFARGGVKSTVD